MHPQPGFSALSAASSQPGSPLLEFRDVSYQYPQSAGYALLNVNLAVQPGEFFGLVGPTGAGKTTLCLAINGIVPQFFGGRFFGSVATAGLDTVENPISTLARCASQVFEDPETQLLATSVENEVAFALENLKFPREVIRERIAEALALVRLDGLEKKHPHELSAGQKQRLAIAAALAVRPALLVLDEPTSQLDPAGTEQVFRTVRSLNRELGITVVMASHAAEEMAEYADRVALLSGGQVVSIGTPDAVYSEIERQQAGSPAPILRPPQVTRLFGALSAQHASAKQQRDAALPPLPVRLEQAVDQICTLYPPTPPARPSAAPSPEPSAARPNPLLSAKNLVYRYPDGTLALNDVSLDIFPGDYLVLAGQNGAGKTTLVKHFLNLLQPAQGTVTLHGRNIAGKAVSELARTIGYVAQNPDNQIFNTTVADEVAFALRNLGYPPGEVENRTSQNLAAMGLEGMRQRHPLSLPRGDRARVVVAAILAMQPEIIIFDEPTTGQDYRGAQQILELTRSLHQMGKTILVISHHLYLMAEYARRMVVMGKGNILLDTSIQEGLYAADTLAQSYLAPPQAVQLVLALRREKRWLRGLLTPEAIANHLAPLLPIQEKP